MSEVLNRFLRYVKINTQSDEDVTDRTPSTEVQWDLARLLEGELDVSGFKDIELDRNVLSNRHITSQYRQKASGDRLFGAYRHQPGFQR